VPWPTPPAGTISAPGTLVAARGDGSHHHLIYQLTGYDLLVLDDWGLAPFKDFEGHDLLDVIEERHGRGSLIISSQLPFQDWHETLPDPTVADAIMDRIIHNSHKAPSFFVATLRTNWKFYWWSSAPESLVDLKWNGWSIPMEYACFPDRYVI
jgi:hypothetical protein